jgi:hypothetical protein
MLWDPATGRQVLSLGGQDETFERLAFSPNGHRLIAVGIVGARLWDGSPAKQKGAAPAGERGPAADPDKGLGRR